MLDRAGVGAVDGLLADLGVSSYQLDHADRGFSFRKEGPLDMRMDRSQARTAAELVNRLSEKELVDTFRRYGEEPAARKIASAIVQGRRTRPIITTTQLSDQVKEVKGGGSGMQRHPATLVFQALRICINEELESLETLLSQAVTCLKSGGRLVLISFHSLEDRIVKRWLRSKSGKCICFRPAEFCTCPREKWLEVLTKRPVMSSQTERIRNPRSRSAKLRAARKIRVSGGP